MFVQLRFEVGSIELFAEVIAHSNQAFWGLDSASQFLLRKHELAFVSGTRKMNWKEAIKLEQVSLICLNKFMPLISNISPVKPAGADLCICAVESRKVGGRVKEEFARGNGLLRDARKQFICWFIEDCWLTFLGFYGELR